MDVFATLQWRSKRGGGVKWRHAHSGVARVHYALGQETFLRPPSTNWSEK